MTGDKGIDSLANGCILKIPPPSLMSNTCKNILSNTT